ncbi:MAG: DUF1365 domain-containing protein [Xanthomonadales bacterium]|nr:DUF1365 domain-containing protein [Xanthomonadales bacterium]
MNIQGKHWLQGGVRHRRHGAGEYCAKAVSYAMQYSVFMVYDEIQALRKRYPDRPWSLMKFKDSDYCSPEKASDLLLEQRIAVLVAQRLNIDVDGPIVLLGHLRQWGLCFNPVSFYLCHNHQHELVAIVAEITNTPWGERHCYAFAAEAIRKQPRHGNPAGQSVYEVVFDKGFHVSPFMPMGLQYRWRFNISDVAVHIFMALRREGNTVFDASLSLRAPSSQQACSKPHLRFPLMVHRVLFHIYRHAAWLYIKGSRFYPHPKKRKITSGIE